MHKASDERVQAARDNGQQSCFVKARTNRTGLSAIRQACVRDGSIGRVPPVTFVKAVSARKDAGNRLIAERILATLSHAASRRAFVKAILKSVTVSKRQP